VVLLPAKKGAITVSPEHPDRANSVWGAYTKGGLSAAAAGERVWDGSFRAITSRLSRWAIAGIQCGYVSGSTLTDTPSPKCVGGGDSSQQDGDRQPTPLRNSTWGGRKPFWVYRGDIIVTDSARSRGNSAGESGAMGGRPFMKPR